MQENKFKIGLKVWEVVVVCVCIVVGLFVAFIVGYRSGHSVGYDYALDNTISNTAKFSVYEDEAPDLDSNSLNEIYARLSDDAITPKEDGKVSEIEVAPIKEEALSINVDKVIPESPVKAMERAMKDYDEEVEIVENKEVVEVVNSKKVEEIQVADNTSLEIAKSNKNLKDLSFQIEEAEGYSKPESSKVEIKQMPKAHQETKEIKYQDNEKKLKLEVDTVKKENNIEIQNSKNKIKSGWYVQTLSSKDSSVANRLISVLKQSGFPAAIETTKLGNENLYRVLVGPESSKEYADRLANQVSREKYITGKPFVKLVK